MRPSNRFWLAFQPPRWLITTKHLVAGTNRPCCRYRSASCYSLGLAAQLNAAWKRLQRL